MIYSLPVSTFECQTGLQLSSVGFLVCCSNGFSACPVDCHIGFSFF